MPRFRSEKNLNGYHLGARSIQPKFPEIFGPKLNGPVWSDRNWVSRKLVHLLRWTTFPGQTGRKFWLNGSRPPKSGPKTFVHPSPRPPPQRNYTPFVDEGYSLVAEPGEGPGGPHPLFLDQTEAPRAEKKKIWFNRPPLLSGSGWPGPSLIWRSGSATVADQSSAALTSIVLTQLTLLPYQRNYSHKK